MAVGVARALAGELPGVAGSVAVRLAGAGVMIRTIAMDAWSVVCAVAAAGDVAWRSGT